MGFSVHADLPCKGKNRRWLSVVILVAATYLMFQSLLLQSSLSSGKIMTTDDNSSLTMHSSAKSVMVRKTEAAMFVGVEEGIHTPNEGGDIVHYDGLNRMDRGSMKTNVVEDGFDIVIELGSAENKENSPFSDKVLETNRSMEMQDTSFENDISVPRTANKSREAVSLEQVEKLNTVASADATLPESLNLLPEKLEDSSVEFHFATLASPSFDPQSNGKNSNNSMPGDSNSVRSANIQSVHTAKENESMVLFDPGKKKMRCNMPPKSVTTIEEMNHIFQRHRASSRSMRPRWSSIRDREILAAKVQIENAPIAVNDQELYPFLFRNVSMFMRSYQLMEQILKVYVYKDGEKPVFHQPILKGLYASEGWFMKLMERSKQFVVKDPRKAHLFYMPFSSRMLEYTVYVRNSHNRTNLREYLKQYTDKIAAKYPYFNRTGGADHFLVACHDWAPYETRHHMERCIKALCNADVTAGFKIGRDVSLPETYVRSARNPLRDLGGKPPSRRHILAFYAGNNHGYLRPVLLKHWKDRDPDMKIFGPMPPGVASKMNYIQHMKSSKYCICPKGYEVNSPRVVEAIFYECVPVIISDNFVPPFFEVLDWGAFSVILAEKDIPNLKNILLSIPEEKYKEMQFRVRKVQRHFLWHAKPVKYDLFHMTLHSIWYNRVFQIKLR